ncbi:MAG: dipeptide epimerase, partial [Chthoniobacterales bacterium]
PAILMKLRFWPFNLRFAHTWSISSTVGSGGKAFFGVVFAELEDNDGLRGIGEASPSARYNETPETVLRFLGSVDPNRLNFNDVAGSMTYLETVAPSDFAAKTALNLALLDGAAKKAGQAIFDFLKLGFTENRHVTSFSIGMDQRELTEKKVRAAHEFPVLKVKVGGPDDEATVRLLWEIAPEKRLRVDANEAWLTKERALAAIEALASYGPIEFVEQPMPADSPARSWEWLRERSPLPLFADESYQRVGDLSRCVDYFDGVNVKLVKTGGITGGLEALTAARRAGLKTMLGCMAESSVLISAAAHLAELTDYLDLDGNLLVTNDPYRGVTVRDGVMSFANTPEPSGLRVRPA